MQFGIFKNILLDLLTGNKTSNNAPDKSLIKLSGKNTILLDPPLSARLKIIEKKNATKQLLIGRLSALKSAEKMPKVRKSLTPSSITMKLIRPSKQKVKVTANAVESTDLKQMRKATVNT